MLKYNNWFVSYNYTYQFCLTDFLCGLFKVSEMTESVLYRIITWRIIDELESVLEERVCIIIDTMIIFRHRPGGLRESTTASRSKNEKSTPPPHFPQYIYIYIHTYIYIYIYTYTHTHIYIYSKPVQFVVCFFGYNEFLLQRSTLSVGRFFHCFFSKMHIYNTPVCLRFRV